MSAITQEQLIAILKIFGQSKLISELLEQTSLNNDSNYLVINQGQDDAKKIKIPLIRGYKGNYNATTNTPSLSNGTGVSGDVYTVLVAGSRDFGNGFINLVVDDIIYYNGSKYVKITQNQISDIIGLQDALNAKNFITSDESLTLAQRKDDILYGILDRYTNEEITLSKVTGTPTVDEIIYFQLGSEYFKRNYDKVTPQMFGAIADGTTNDTTAIQNAITFCQTNNEVLEIIGDFACNTITVSNNLEIETNCNLQILTDVDGLIITGRSTGYGDANITKLKHNGILNIRGFANNSLKRGIVLKNGTLYSSFDKVFISNFGLGVDYEASGNNNIITWNLLDVRDCSGGESTTFTKGSFVSPNTIFNIGEITTPIPILTNVGSVLILQDTDGSDYRAYPIVEKPSSVNTYYIGNFDQLPSSGTLVYYTGGGVMHQKHTDNGAIQYKSLRLGGIAGASLTVQSFYGVTVNGGQIEGCYSSVIVGGIYMNGVNPETIYTIRCLFEGLHTEVNDANNPLIYSLKKSMIVFEGNIIPQPFVGAPETGVKFYDPSGSDRVSNMYYGKPTVTFPIIEPIDPTFKIYNDVADFTDLLTLDLRDLLSGMSYVGDSRIKHTAVGEYNLLNIPAGETRTLRVRPFGWNTINGGTANIDIEIVGVANKDEYKITFLLVDKDFTFYIDSNRDAETLDGLNSTDFVNLTDTQTIGGVKTFSDDIKLTSNKRLVLSTGGYSSIEFDTVGSVNWDANNIIYVSQGTKHFFLDDNGELAEVVADTFTGNSFRLNALNNAPASSTSTGTTGEIRYTADYIYVCVATNTWKRSNLTNW